MPGETSCYNVFFQTASISGKWLGDKVTFQYDGATSGQNSFSLGMHGKLYDWYALSSHIPDFKFAGSEPVSVSTMHRNASADLPAGDDIKLSLGQRHPVALEVWSTKGANELTNGKDVQFLNIEVHGLPHDSGGILGMDAYTRPAVSECGLIKSEETLEKYIDQDLASLARLGSKKRLKWTLSAQVQAE